MIVPDINLLLYAYDDACREHARARAWWEGLLCSATPVGLAWVVALGFIRIGTNPKLSSQPLGVVDACALVRRWLTQPHVSLLDPGERHPAILFGLLERLGTAGNLTTDAHLAALAIEYQAELHSSDADFSRFPGLRWRNPLK